GIFISVSEAQTRMKDVQTYNFEQKIMSVNPKMSEADMDYFWGRYGYLRDIDV
ncbi:unnamed protein product, partial [marine sediment metagenome]